MIHFVLLFICGKIGKNEVIKLYIVQVLVEHPTHALDTNFDYLSKEELKPGVRVAIVFGYQRIIGYVTGCKYSEKCENPSV